MDWFLLVIAFLFLIAGLAGAVLPVLPGPPLSFLGLLILHFSSQVQFSLAFLVVAALVAALITVLDYVIPNYFTQKLKASPAAVRGTFVGTLLGLFLIPPVGILIFPILGAFVGELIFSNDVQKAFKSAFASFAGLVGGIVIKGVYGLWALVYGAFALF
ncbi:DUF456 domain-containing protein [Thermaurantimonas aggregans]|uniref:DUF456 domain-containing protein n=1 Tax=Thermaurantimonas aggregans TaxID=2173829 RepID=UPI0023F2B775|nr:DUF456 domain-containing protein [Thermaurantimonas aggregans]MCX8149088.1 DUF456 domain-containing protein [Thermaurantimonas aggregans]